MSRTKDVFGYAGLAITTAVTPIATARYLSYIDQLPDGNGKSMAIALVYGSLLGSFTAATGSYMISKNSKAAYGDPPDPKSISKIRTGKRLVLASFLATAALSVAAVEVAPENSEDTTNSPLVPTPEDAI